MNNNTIGYIICETASTEPASPKILTTQNDRVEIEACLQDMNVKNRNGRFYDDKELGPQIKNKRLTELMKTGNLFGEAGHPVSNDLARQQTIDPTNMSHQIKSMWIEGNKIMAIIASAHTRVGDDFDRVVRGGTLVSFSLRALGRIKNTPRGAEVVDVRPMTWDWVVFPSHEIAYMTKIMNLNESVIDGMSNNLFLNKNDKGLIVPIDNRKVTDYIKEQSSNIKNVIESFEFMYESVQVIDLGQRVQLKGLDGNTLVVNLEKHIRNEIMNYVSGRF